MFTSCKKHKGFHFCIENKSLYVCSSTLKMTYFVIYNFENSENCLFTEQNVSFKSHNVKIVIEVIPSDYNEKSDPVTHSS